MMTALETAIAAETHARSKHTEAVAARDAAKARVEETKELFGGDPSKARRSAKRDAQDQLDDAEDVLRHATKELESRRAAREATEREEKQTRLATHSAALATWPTAVEAAIARLVEIDRQLSAAVLALAHATADAIDHFDEAEALAGALLVSRKFQQDHARPSIPNAQLEVRRAITRARAEEDRDDVSAFIASVEDNWMSRELSGEEYERHTRAIAATRQAEAAQATADATIIAINRRKSS
jgi:hypothetical protein